MAHNEASPSNNPTTMNRLWRDREREQIERDRERTISKLRQEASLKRVSAAVEKSGSEQRPSPPATIQSERLRLLNQARESAQQQMQPAPRSAMAKLFASRTDQSLASRAPSSSSSFDPEYSRRSEPALLKPTDAMLTMDKQQEMEATELRFRRSLPAASGRATQDLAFALQSALQPTDTSSRASSSGSSSSSSSAPVGFLPRTAGPTLSTVSELHATRVSELSRPLERARSADVANKGEPVDDMTRLRQQVTLLLRTLEEEKKRRAMEQKLMQQKILELQGLIRHNMPEQKRELERSLQSASIRAATTPASAPAAPGSSQSSASLRALRTSRQIQKAQEQSPYKTMKLLSELRPEEAGGNTDDEHDAEADDDENDDDDDDGHNDDHEREAENGEGDDRGDTDNNNNSSSHAAADDQPSDSTRRSARASNAKMGQQLTQLRAQMRALVQEAQQEAQALRKCLDDERRAYERKERQLRMEASLRVTSLEERYAYAKKKLLAKTSLLTSQVNTLTEEKEKLEREVREKNQRIEQLELAVGGRRIVHESNQNS